MMRRLSLACAGCYAAVQFHLFKPSDILGPFLACVGGNPAYVDAEYEVWFTCECNEDGRGPFETYDRA